MHFVEPWNQNGNSNRNRAVIQALSVRCNRRGRFPCAADFNLLRRGSARWKIVLFLAGIATVATSLAIRPFLRVELAARTELAMQSAQETLESGDLANALKLAQAAHIKARRTGRGVGSSLVILGMVREQLAKSSTPAERLGHYTAAAQHYSEALRAGITADEELKVNHYLGRCLHARNQFAECIPLLEKSLSDFPDGKAEALSLLTLAHLDSSRLDLAKAYEYNTKIFQLTDLTPEELGQAWEIRRSLLQRLGRPDLLAGIDIISEPFDARWIGALVRASDSFQEKQFDAALASLNIVAKQKGLSQEVERRTWYLMALAAREKGDHDSALNLFQQVEWRFPDSPEARVAATHAGAVLLVLNRTDQAVATLNRAAQMAASGVNAHSVPIGSQSLGRVVASAIDRFRELGQFELAAELLDGYRSLVSAPVPDRAAATVFESWAESTLDEGGKLSTAEFAKACYQAEELYRKAGAFHIRVADAVESTDECAKALWHAAKDFLRGRGFVPATNALERLLATGVTGGSRAEALALMCGALEVGGKPELVFDVADCCINEFPNHPATAKARYHLARCQIGFGELDLAETNLRTILGAAAADADPAIVQQSRLILGHMLLDLGREEDAIPRLHDLLAASAEPDTEREARLILSDCLRRRARRPAGRLIEAQSHQAKTHYRHRKDEDLDQSLVLLNTLERDLAALERSDRLTPIQAEWLHKCRWDIGECLYEADRTEEAISVFMRFSETYTAPADWLEAQIQIANCHDRMNRVETARSVLRAAHERMRQLPSETIEQLRIGMSPERWKEWLDRVQQL